MTEPQADTASAAVLSNSSKLDASDACVRHAKDLVRAGSVVLAEGLPNIAFHLGILALEEIGKSEFLGMLHIAASRGEQFVWAEKRLEDHEAKLFWALFGVNLGTGKITNGAVEEVRAFSSRLHDKRLKSMYVSESHGPQVPLTEIISEGEAKTILDLAEARIGLVGERRTKPLSEEEQERLEWFYSAAADEELSKRMFSNPSMEKLEELKDVKKWVGWLRDTIEQDKRESRQALEKELSRKQPEGSEAEVDKWRVRVRFFTLSHQIKSGTLNWFNGTGAWFKFVQVDGKKDQFLVDITLPKNVPIAGLWWIALGHSRLIATALNIGTRGLFWWDFPRNQALFYERLQDLETNHFVEINAGDTFKGKFRRQNIKRSDLGHFALCLAGVAKELDEGRSAPFDAYLQGVCFVAKSDVHFNFLRDACRCFGECLRRTAEQIGDLRERGIKGLIEEKFPKLPQDARERLSLLCEAPNDDDTKDVTLEDTLSLKVICDAYVIMRFQKEQSALRAEPTPSS